MAHLVQQRLHGYGTRLRKVPPRRHDHELVPLEQGALEPLRLHVVGDEGKVDRVLLHKALRLAVRALDDVHLDAGMAAHERAQGLCQPQRDDARRGGDGNGAGVQPAQGLHVAKQVVVAAAQPVRVLQHGLAVAREHQRGAAAVEQPQLQVGLEARDHAAHGGLRAAQLLGGAREAAEAGARHERPELADVCLHACPQIPATHRVWPRRLPNAKRARNLHMRCAAPDRF